MTGFLTSLLFEVLPALKSQPVSVIDLHYEPERFHHPAKIADKGIEISEIDGTSYVLSYETGDPWPLGRFKAIKDHPFQSASFRISFIPFSRLDKDERTRVLNRLARYWA